MPLLGMGRPPEYHDECRPVRRQTDAGRDPRRRQDAPAHPGRKVLDLVPPPAHEPETAESRLALLYQCVDLGARELVRVLSGQSGQTPMMPGSLPNLILSSAKAINLISGGITPTFGDMIFAIPDPNSPKTTRD